MDEGSFKLPGFGRGENGECCVGDHPVCKTVFVTAWHDKLISCVTRDVEVETTFEKHGERATQGGGCEPVSQMIAQNAPAQGAPAF